MRTFTVYRKSPPPDATAQGRANAPDEPQFQGVVFDDGSVAVRWLTAYRSTSTWDNLESLEKVHGHPEYDTQWVWQDIPADHWLLRTGEAPKTREVPLRKRSPDEVRKRLLSAGTVLPAELAQQLVRELARDLGEHGEGCAR